jgi:sugar fermentation stimulation protein A
MKFSAALTEARLIKRYKRFLADVELNNGQIITVHCANTGAMTGCQPSQAAVWLSHSNNPKRKYPYSWELVQLGPSALACINTALTNKVAEEAITSNVIAELSDYERCQREVVYGEEKSRIDFLLERASQQCFVEVKHLTLKLNDRTGAFPDAVTLRGQKHLRELMSQARNGDRAVLLFIVMRTDVDQVMPAEDIDPDYARLLRQAVNEGVEVLAYATHIDQDEIKVTHAIPVLL